MRIGTYEVKLQPRATLAGWQAAVISILAIVVALTLFSIIFILAGVNPLVAYREIVSYAFLNPFGLPLTINRCIFLLLCTYAEARPWYLNPRATCRDSWMRCRTWKMKPILETK